VISCTVSREKPEEPTLLARRASPIHHHLLTGELIAERAVVITAPDVGVRPLEIRWMVENGTMVAAGDPLFEFDNSALASRLDERRVAVLEARSRIASMQSETGSKVADAEFELERRKAEAEKARIDASIPSNLRSEQEYERLQVELWKAQRRVVDAERLLRSTRATTRAEVEKEALQLGKEEAALRQIEGGIAQLAVSAPIAGAALIGRNSEQDRQWEVGDVIYPGHRLAELPDLSTLMVRARLFDVDDGRIRPGMPATIELDAHPGVEFAGRAHSVDRIAFQRNRDGSTRVFWVVVDLDSVDLERMRAGMSVKVTFEPELGQGSEGAIVAPRESLDLSDLESPRALLADGSWRSVEIGPCTPLECVIAQGLAEGEALGRIHVAGEES
jgi:multidrug resistance efflux pump